MKIVIIDYGAGNIKSVKFAIERLGYKAILSNNPNEIQSADKIIFPGVGDASFAMKMLKKFNLDVIIPELKQPVLGICLGMQLLCNFSEEGSTNCLKIINANVLKFKTEQKVPHTGWNSIYNLKSRIFDNIPENDFMYFVHSYYVEKSEFTISECNYAENFSAAIQKDNFYGCQFHPEKSGKSGELIIKNFLEL